MNNIIILGAGALGSVVGALLSKNKNNHVLLVGNKGHVIMIKKKGLQLQGLIEDTFHLATEEKITAIPQNTMIFIMVKCYDLVDTLKEIKHLLRKDTILVCLSNGLEIKELVMEEVGNACSVVRGISYLGCIFLELGKVFYTGGEITELEQTPYDKRFYEIFGDTGLTVKTYREFKEREFKKAIMNATLNPLTTLLNCYTRVLAEKRYTYLVEKMINECIIIAEKEGIYFKEDLVAYFNKIIQESSNNKSSMLQDVNRGKKTEIDFINGKFIELAKKHDIQAPLNTALVTLVKTLEPKHDQ